MHLDMMHQQNGLCLNMSQFDWNMSPSFENIMKFVMAEWNKMQPKHSDTENSGLSDLMASLSDFGM